MDVSWAQWINDFLDWVRETGPLGWLAFIGLYALTCVFFLPGSLLTVGAGAIYGFWYGTLLVTVSSTVGAVVNFLTTRYLARNWVERRLAGSCKFQALEQAVGREGWQIILLSRISPILPHSVVSYASGLTRISLRRYAAASFLGFIPLSAAYAYAGAVLGRFARTSAGVSEQDIVTWILYGIGLIVTVVVMVLTTRAATKVLAGKVEPSSSAAADKSGGE